MCHDILALVVKHRGTNEIFNRLNNKSNILPCVMKFYIFVLVSKVKYENKSFQIMYFLETQYLYINPLSGFF